MQEMIMSASALPEPLSKLIRTEHVKVEEIDGVIHLVPLEDEFDSTFGLRGMFAGHEDMTVDRFLERKSMDDLLTSDHHEFDEIEKKENIRFRWIR